MGRKAQPAQIQFIDGRLTVEYPDRRIAPRKCDRTGMLRVYCPCAPCRVLRRKKHRADCHCYLCFSDRMGKFVDDLGRETQAGRWLWFITLTFRTPHFPWCDGFPIEQPQPNADFVEHFFARMLRWIEQEVHCPVEFFVAHQFGELGGRIHLHCGLSWPNLFEYRWNELQAMLWKSAGFNRILPWEQDAGYYIARYIGRDAHRANWRWNVGIHSAPLRLLRPIGRNVIAASPAPDNSSREFRRTMGAWHR